MTRLRQKDKEKQKRGNWTKLKQILKRKRKLEEEEKLLAEREEFHSELDMDRDIGEEKEQDACLPSSLQKMSSK